MSVYESLIKQLFFSKSESGLILLPEAEEVDNSQSKSSGEFTFSIDFEQFGWTIHKLPDGDDFVAAVIGILKKEKPSAVFLFPVWKSRQLIDPRLRKMYIGNSLEMMTLLSALDTVQDGTQVATVLPPSAVWSLSEKESREKLTSVCKIDYVIESSPDSLLSNVAINTVTLVLRKQATDEQNLTFLQLDHNVEDDRTTFFRGVAQLAQNQASEMPYGYRYVGNLNEDSSLSYISYHPRYDRLKQEFLDHFSDIEKLENLCDVVPSIRLIKHSPSSQSHEQLWVDLYEDYPDEVVPILNSRDINGQYGINRDKISRGIENPDNRYRLQKGDMCLPRVAKSPLSEVVLVTESDLPLVASPNVIVLRPKEKVTKEQKELLFNYLQSDYARQFLEQSSPTLSLSIPSLRALMIPKPTDALLEALHELRNAESAYSIWIDEVRQARSNLFEIPDSKDTRLQLKAETRRVRQRYQVAASIDDFATRVRTRLPHPIAYRWKIIETSYPDYEGYKHILECAEVAVAYLASIAIVMAHEAGITLGETISEAKSLGEGKSHGKTFGYWKRVLGHASQAFKDSDSSISFFDVIRFAEVGLGDGTPLDFLYHARNDDAHGEGPKGYQVGVAYADALAHLKLLLESIEFLSEYRLLYIENTRRDTQSKATFYDYRELVGDHYLVPIVEEECIEDCEIEANSLYIVDRDDQLHLLRPVLLWHPASDRNRSAMFYLNRYDDDNDICEIRSLELGDAIEIHNMTSQFISAGLLVSKES